MFKPQWEILLLLLQLKNVMKDKAISHYLSFSFITFTPEVAESHCVVCTFLKCFCHCLESFHCEPFSETCDWTEETYLQILVTCTCFWLLHESPTKEKRSIFMFLTELKQHKQAFCHLFHLLTQFCDWFLFSRPIQWHFVQKGRSVSHK